MKIYWNIPPDDKKDRLNDGDFFNFFLHHRGESTDLNVQIIDKWIKFLLDAKADFVTLNPIIPNFMSDDFAKKYIYVFTKNGFKKLGDVKSTQFKFDLLGPGEVLVDTDWRESE